MQFKVPQNIDLEDKIVGPLTLIQFVYVLVGGLICYIIFQLMPSQIGWVLLFDIPIALIFLALAFLKIQDQPLSHFLVAGLQYFNRPKTRFWIRQGQNSVIIYQAPVQVEQKDKAIPKKKIEKSDLEKLANVLDTQPLTQAEEQNFGKITQNFEKMIRSASNSQEYNKIFNQKGGQVGNLGKTKTTNS